MEENKIILPSTSIMVTEACTLKCKLCLAFVPYYKKHFHMNLQEAEAIFERYFQIVDEVEKISITGGEPLLNPELNSILKLLYDYSDKITKEIIFITNGTIPLSDTTLEIFASNKKTKVIVNNYCDLSPHAEENYRRLCEWGINAILYTEDNRYGWIDCRNHNLKHKTQEACEQQAQECAFFQGKKYVIDRGNLYTCTRAAYRIQENIIPYTEDAFLNLLEREMPIELQRKKLKMLLTAKSTISCAYCDGLTEKSVKYKAAEQL